MILLISGSIQVGVVEFILNNGNLSSRIITALEGDYTHKSLQRIYRKLTECLAENKMFNELFCFN